MKRRLQMFLERTYGSAYSDGQGQSAPAAHEGSSPAVATGQGAKGKKGRAAKYKPAKSQTPPPDGGRFDLRCLQYGLHSF